MFTYQNLLTDHDLTEDSSLAVADWSPALQGCVLAVIAVADDEGQELPGVIEYYAADLNGGNEVKIGEQLIGVLRKISLMVDVTPPKLAVKYIANSTTDEGYITITCNRNSY
ncbi:MAG TPA: hypothetical protein DCS19_04200 [Flavobacterium sp.]|nr:hypothetical protein [Flavobacterium sp.]